ncbi:uncharacterized mitochondrial protein-like protein [Tanacetum coccineum]
MVTQAFNIKNSMIMLVQKSQEGQRSQDDGKRLCLVDDIKEFKITFMSSQRYNPMPKVKDHYINSQIHFSRIDDAQTTAIEEGNEISGTLKAHGFSSLESGSDQEDANEHIEKVLEIVDLFHIPNITIDQVMLIAFPMSLTGVASRWLRNEPTCSITTWDDLKTKFLNKYCPPARTAKKMEEINNFQFLIQEVQYHLRLLLMQRLAAIQAQLNNLGREIKKVNEKVYAAQVGCKQCKGPHYTKDCPLKEEGKTLEEAYYTQFGKPFQGRGYRAAALGFS